MPIKSEVAQLLLHCPDKPGILAEVTDFITVNKGNIVYLDQYVDHAENVFFMRIAWELDGFLIPKEKIEDYFQTLYGRKYQMIFRLYFSDAKPRMAVFVSRMSHCLYDMLARYTAGEWNVEIPLIVSNHPDLEHVARRFDIPFYLFPITKQNKERQEAEEMRLLAENRINFIVLARYMQIVSEKMIEAYPNRIINIHHSFLPAFVGARPYHAAYERGVKIIGATSHYVTTELDAGRSSSRRSSGSRTRTRSRIWSTKGRIWKRSYCREPSKSTSSERYWYTRTRRSFSTDDRYGSGRHSMELF